MQFSNLPHDPTFSEPSERGTFLVVVSALLFFMMLLVGYAADSGVLFNAQLTAQKAADAAALSGASYLALQSGDFAGNNLALDAQVRNATNAAARHNLLQSEFTGPQILQVASQVVRTPNALVPGNSQLSVRVTIRVDVPLTVLRYMPGLGRTRQVRAVAESTVRPAIVTLVLDNSGSMGCPNYDPSSGLPLPDCSCFPNCANKKIDFLKSAVVNNFLTRLDSVRDIVSITTFNTVATPLAAGNPAGGFNRAALTAAVNGITEGGATNFCDALNSAYDTVLPALTQKPDYDRTFILFSDGAPTAVRMVLANPKPALNPSVNGQYDYYLWGVDWQVPPDPTKYDGVSRLTPAVIPNINLCNNVECPTSAACSVSSFPGGPNDPANDEIGNCANDLKFRDRAGNIWPTINAPVSSYRQRFMDCAIPVADWIRGQRAVWLTVGLGEDPVGALPYEDPLRDANRKDNYLRRIALEATGIAEFPGFTTSTVLLGDIENQSPGEYFPTPSAASLPAIFDSMVSRIKLQMIQ